MSYVSDAKVLLGMIGGFVTFFVVLGLVFNYYAYLSELREADTIKERTQIMKNYLTDLSYDVVNMTIDEIESAYQYEILNQLDT